MGGLPGHIEGQSFVRRNNDKEFCPQGIGIIFIEGHIQRLRKPTSPGEIIRAHYLEPLQMDVGDLARHLGMDIKELSGVVDGAFPVTVDIAMRLSKALSTSPELWMNLQMALDLWNARQAPDKWNEVQPIILADA